jgi:hypothetical protein
MDDYVTHRSKDYVTGSWRKDKPVKSFYVSDDSNNNDLVSNVSLSNQVSASKVNVVKLLQDNRKKVIVDIISKEMAYATNNNNFYANNLGSNIQFCIS